MVSHIPVHWDKERKCLKREEEVRRTITNKELTLLCFMIDIRHDSFLSGLPTSLYVRFLFINFHIFINIYV